MSDILDDLLNDNEQPAANEADAAQGTNPENVGVTQNKPGEDQPDGDEVVEPTGPAEGVEIIDDMGNYETKGPF